MGVTMAGLVRKCLVRMTPLLSAALVSATTGYVTLNKD